MVEDYPISQKALPIYTNKRACRESSKRLLMVFQVFSVVFWWQWWFFWRRQIWWHNGCFLAYFDGVVVVVDFPATIDLDGCLRVEMVR
jgi:hypothetical protein